MGIELNCSCLRDQRFTDRAISPASWFSFPSLSVQTVPQLFTRVWMDELSSVLLNVPPPLLLCVSPPSGWKMCFSEEFSPSWFCVLVTVFMAVTKPLTHLLREQRSVMFMVLEGQRVVSHLALHTWGHRVDRSVWHRTFFTLERKQREQGARTLDQETPKHSPQEHTSFSEAPPPGVPRSSQKGATTCIWPLLCPPPPPPRSL